MKLQNDFNITSEFLSAKLPPPLQLDAFDYYAMGIISKDSNSFIELRELISLTSIFLQSINLWMLSSCWSLALMRFKQMIMRPTKAP